MCFVASREVSRPIFGHLGGFGFTAFAPMVGYQEHLLSKTVWLILKIILWLFFVDRIRAFFLFTCNPKTTWYLTVKNIGFLPWAPVYQNLQSIGDENSDPGPHSENLYLIVSYLFYDYDRMNLVALWVCDDQVEVVLNLQNLLLPVEEIQKHFLLQQMLLLRQTGKTCLASYSGAKKIASLAHFSENTCNNTTQTRTDCSIPRKYCALNFAIEGRLFLGS